MNVLLDRYRLVERIALGGMGEVFRAIDQGYGGIERPVAVKRIAPEWAADPEFSQTFLAEARLTFLLGHANVVRVLDIGHDGNLFLVLEWVDGADLGTILSSLHATDQAMPVPLALAIVAEAARGLDYAHRVAGADGQPLGIVHRDVSPSNLLLSVEGEVKVTDFGIARSRLRRSASMPGMLKGKLFYMSPEQALGEADPRADVFALGAVLYEMLCGCNPFEGSDRDLLDRVRSGAYPPPSQLDPTIDPALEALVLAAMAPQREARLQTCAELREHIERYALQAGLVLSLDELGRLVRGLVGQGLIERRAVDKTQPGLRPQPATVAPKKPRVAFDFAALGGRAAPTGEHEPLGPAGPISQETPALRRRPTAVRAAASSGDSGNKPPPPSSTVDATPADGSTAAAVAAAHEALESERTLEMDAPPVRAVTGPRPVAAHALVSLEPGSDAERRATPADDFSSAPTRASGARSGRGRTEALGGLGLLLAGAAVAVGYQRWQPVATPPSAPPLVAGTAPTPAPPPPPVTNTAPAANPPTPSLGSSQGAARPAVPPKTKPKRTLLTVESDEPGDVYVDGELIGGCPLYDHELVPGEHQIRVQSSKRGLYLIPHERTITLRAGESKRLFLPLQGGSDPRGR